MQAGNSFQTSFHITAYVGSDSYVYFRGEGPAAGGFYPGCTASGHRGQYSDCCRYEYAIRCNSGSSGGAAGDAGQGVSNTSAVGVAQVTSVVRTVVHVSLAHAAVGSSVGLVAALFAQQAVPDEDSSFSVSPLSPGLFFRPPRGSTSPPAGWVLLPTTLEDFDDSVLGDPITYARCEQFPGSESPFSLPVCVAVRFGHSAGPSSISDCVGFGDLRSTNGGVLDCCPSHGLGRGRVIRDRTTVMPIPIFGVRRSAVCRCKPGIWFPASSSSFSGVRGSSGVGPAPVSSCCSCMNCRCCSGGPASSGVIVLIQILPLHDQSDTRMMTFIGDWLPVQNIPRRWW